MHPSPIARRICPCRTSANETLKSQVERESTKKEVDDTSKSQAEGESNMDKADESIKTVVESKKEEDKTSEAQAERESNIDKDDEKIKSEVTKSEPKERFVTQAAPAGNSHENTLSWMLGENDEDCLTTCMQSGHICDEEAWPTTEEGWRAVVSQTEGLQCTSHERGTWAFNPAICTDGRGCAGTCFWEGRGSRCRGGTRMHPSPIARRICPCRASANQTTQTIEPDVSLTMTVRLRHGSTEAEVLAKMRGHKFTLKTTLEAHFGYKSVQVLDIMIAGRRLGVDHGVAKLSAALRVFGTPRTTTLDLGHALHKAFLEAGAGLHIESAAMEWTTEPIDSPTGTANNGKRMEDDENHVLIVVLSSCVGIAAVVVLAVALVLLLRRLKRKGATNKNAQMSAVGPSVAQDLESAATKDNKVKDETQKWELESASTVTPSSSSASDEACNSGCVTTPSSTQDEA